MKIFYFWALLFTSGFCFLFAIIFYGLENWIPGTFFALTGLLLVGFSKLIIDNP